MTFGFKVESEVMCDEKEIRYFKQRSEYLYVCSWGGQISNIMQVPYSKHS